MTSIIKLQSFSGVYSESAPCYLLQVDEFRFLLDCGWDETYMQSIIKDLKKHIHQIDAVLLSYPDASHLGILPYAVGKLGLNCPIYSTIPVYKMGQMFMYDFYQSKYNYEDFDLFTLDDVDAAFDKIVQLKYNQTMALKGKGLGLTITPLPAGHMIGGTIWRIVKDGEEDIVYAVDFNHKNERHLNGCVLENITRPSLLITDAYNALYNQARRKERDEMLMNSILKTLRKGGNVLIAIDTAGRVLELALMLDTFWQNLTSGLIAYSLALLNNVSYNVVEFAKSQVEWMSDKIMRSFEGARNNPFQFKHIQLCHSLAELEKVPGPKVVLASPLDMESGFSRDLFIQWCANSKNTVILTSRSPPGTLARKLIDNPHQQKIALEIRQRIVLEGADLAEYMKKEKTSSQSHVVKQIEEVELSSESDEDMEDDNGAVGGKLTNHDIMFKTEGELKSPGFFKKSRKSFPMYPCKEEKIKWDDYGEIIKPEDYMILDFPQDEEPKKEKVEAAEELPDTPEIPTKCLRTVKTLEMECSIEFIDFEGRSDGDSIMKILSQIKPRRLVIVRGTPKSTDFLAMYCKTAGCVQDRIFTPELHEVVDATTESHIYQVKLKDSLVSSLQFIQLKDGAELTWVDGQICMNSAAADEPEEEKTLDPKTQLESNLDNIPVLEPLSSDQTGHDAVLINEVKLSDFKQVLLRAGLQAEFSSGVLYCNGGLMAIRRNEAGRINIEGCICPEYFIIRKLSFIVAMM